MEGVSKKRSISKQIWILTVAKSTLAIMVVEWVNILR